MGLLQKLFGREQEEQEEEGTQPLPYEFYGVRWAHSGRTKGLGGNRNKKIVHIVAGEVVQEFNYHPLIVRNIKNVLKKPVLDETGGNQVPQHDPLANYLPNVIAWDQSNLDL